VACGGELPGMGAVGGETGGNFRWNVSGWDALFVRIPPQTHPDAPLPPLPVIRTAPMTGAVQNMGFALEGDWYRLLAEGCSTAGVRVSIGDGAPDEKLKYGIAALREHNLKGAVFIKPYAQENIFERIEWCAGVDEIIGIDVDSWRIKTMAGMAELHKKTAAELIEIKKRCRVPFALKGIFTEEDLELVRLVKPDIAVVSNHGGRVETRSGSSASFLADRGTELAKLCGEVWADGGIRKPRDLYTAGYFGAKTVLVGRPFVTGVLRWGAEGIGHVRNNLTGNKGQNG
jgi:isopentenyl diphosphate isomerase/L-lactate dehydrogenase-like FMN-dependent dehydrogenase